MPTTAPGNWEAWAVEPVASSAAAAAQVARFDGDFDGDGRADVATMNSEGTVTVSLSDGDQFTNSVWSTHWSPPWAWARFQVGDFNNDDKDDFVAFSHGGNFYVAISDGASFQVSLWARWSPAVYWQSLHVGDFNFDGKDDIAAVTTNGRWWVGASTGKVFVGSQWGTMVNLPAAWVSYHSGDFTGDKRPDVAAYNGNGEWWLLHSTGNAFGLRRWSAAGPGGTDWQAFQVGDFTGDGKDDLAGLRHDGQWWVFWSTGKAFNASLWATRWAGPTWWRAFRVGDFTGDGRDDIAAFHANGQWWLAHARGSWFSMARWDGLLPSARPQELLAADFDADGAADLFAPSAGELLVGRGGADVFLPFPVAQPGSQFVSAAGLEAIRSDPNNMADVFASYKAALKQRLGPAFSRLTDQGLAFVFASNVSYQLASYRGFLDPDGTYPAPNLGSLKALSESRKLVCNEYCYLAYLLYRKIYPKAENDPVDVQMLGWDKGPFGNHAQLMIKGVGVPLLLDPTSGLIAAVDLQALRDGDKVPAEAAVYLSIRRETTAFMESALASFRGRVYSAVRNGLYPQCVQLYQIDLNKVAWLQA